ncbi:MAG: copper-binding protein [Pyrinomonadaceae bacterium]|nr:copper-binding protein [Pyrinomonadaceae bacterium]
MRTNKFIPLTFSLLFSACQPNMQTPNIQNVAPASPSYNANSANRNAVGQNSNQTASPSPTIAADKSKIKTFDGTGAVTKVNLEIGSVELNHEEIKGLMPKMIMEFYVSDKKMLDQLKVGDKVDFVLEDNAGAEQIVSIKKSK